MPDPYYVCEACAHYWASPESPDRCENCDAHPSNLIECADLEAAEDESEICLVEIMEAD